MKHITSFLETVKLARKQVHRNMTLFPLLAADGITPHYLVMEQALEKDRVHITELDQDGIVPELKLVNKGEKPVLVVEGEELVGAKQNRTVNVSFLIAGKSEMVLPVSCVEQGRWEYESNRFSSGKRMMHASLRQRSQQDVNCSLRHDDGYRSDQGRIWDDIADKSARMKVEAPTGAMAEIFFCYEDGLTEFLEAFQLVDWQVGAVFAINGQILGLECFGCHDTFKRFFDKLVKSYALDALDSVDSSKSDSPPPAKARRFIASARKGKGETSPSIGQGINIMFASRTVSGAALVEGDRVLHLSAFRKDGTGRVGFQRHSRRRNNRIY
jgi:hypothetical protein